MGVAKSSDRTHDPIPTTSCHLIATSKLSPHTLTRNRQLVGHMLVTSLSQLTNTLKTLASLSGMSAQYRLVHISHHTFFFEDTHHTHGHSLPVANLYCSVAHTLTTFRDPTDEETGG